MEHVIMATKIPQANLPLKVRVQNKQFNIGMFATSGSNNSPTALKFLSHAKTNNYCNSHVCHSSQVFHEDPSIVNIKLLVQAALCRVVMMMRRRLFALDFHAKQHVGHFTGESLRL